jgi:hypothetical protein
MLRSIVVFDDITLTGRTGVVRQFKIWYTCSKLSKKAVEDECESKQQKLRQEHLQQKYGGCGNRPKACPTKSLSACREEQRESD